MAQDEVLLNQREILANQKGILENQAKLAKLLSNQSAESSPTKSPFWVTRPSSIRFWRRPASATRRPGYDSG